MSSYSQPMQTPSLSALLREQPCFNFDIDVNEYQEYMSEPALDYSCIDTSAQAFLKPKQEDKEYSLVDPVSLTCLSPLEQSYDLPVPAAPVQSSYYELPVPMAFPAHPTHTHPAHPVPTQTNNYEPFKFSPFDSLPPVAQFQGQVFQPSPSPSPYFEIDRPSTSTHVGKVQKKRKTTSCHINSSCVNCGTRETSLWRRNDRGEVECNSCNLYYRKNGKTRPLALKKEGIMKRQRKPRFPSPEDF